MRVNIRILSIKTSWALLIKKSKSQVQSLFPKWLSYSNVKYFLLKKSKTHAFLATIFLIDCSFRFHNSLYHVQCLIFLTSSNLILLCHWLYTYETLFEVSISTAMILNLERITNGLLYYPKLNNSSFNLLKNIMLKWSESTDKLKSYL